MTSLHQLQERFVASLVLRMTDPLLFSLFNSVPSAQTVSLWRQDAQFISSHIGKTTIHQRFDLYRNNWREGLFKTLKNIYPVCVSLVGEACFRALSDLFIQHSISQHFSLNAFGREFSHFIESYAKEWALSYLPHVAKLEWIIHQSALGPKNEEFSFESLREIPESQRSKVIFSLAENGDLFYSPFPVDKIWSLHQDWQENPTSMMEGTIELHERDNYLFVYRQDAKDHFICLAPLTSLEWQLLTCIKAGITLGELYKSLINTEEGEAVLALASCVQKGYITKFSI